MGKEKTVWYTRRVEMYPGVFGYELYYRDKTGYEKILCTASEEWAVKDKADQYNRKGYKPEDIT